MAYHHRSRLLPQFLLQTAKPKPAEQRTKEKHAFVLLDKGFKRHTAAKAVINKQKCRRSTIEVVTWLVMVLNAPEKKGGGVGVAVAVAL